MEVTEAIDILKFVSETDEEKTALSTLVQALNSKSSSGKSDNASFKQVSYIQKLAFDADVDAMEEVREMGIEKRTLKELTKKEASKVISEFISRGYKQ